VFLATFNSAVLLYEYTIAKTVLMSRERQDLYALAYLRTFTCASVAGSVDPQVMPYVDDPLQYWAAEDKFGSPTPEFDSLHSARSPDFEEAIGHLMCRR
jgi:hypothetical protein